MSSKTELINVLILAVGRVEADREQEELPICLTEIGGLSLLERILEKSSVLADTNYTFVFSYNDAKKYHLNRVSEILKPESFSVLVPETTKGSLCTALLAASTLDQDSELLIISANELVDVELDSVINGFRSDQLGGGVLVFKSIQPRYSYVRLDDDGFVSEAAQRRPISQNATTGIFWFSKTADFVAGAKSMIKKDTTVDGAFFIAPVFNELILESKKVGIHRIGVNEYLPLKTQKQIDLYEAGELS